MAKHKDEAEETAEVAEAPVETFTVEERLALELANDRRKSTQHAGAASAILYSISDEVVNGYLRAHADFLHAHEDIWRL